MLLAAEAWVCGLVRVMQIFDGGVSVVRGHDSEGLMEEVVVRRRRGRRWSCEDGEAKQGAPRDELGHVG